MKSISTCAKCMLACCLAMPVYAQSTNNLNEINSFTLDNGITVIVATDNRADAVTQQVWYRVGASYEALDKTGISHVLEHMMFKGSQKFSPGEGSVTLSNLGAQDNAFTTADFTVYYQIISRENLHVAMEIEADRMQNLLLPEEEFMSEIKVIQEERRLRVDDSPYGLLQERLTAAVFSTGGGYINPVIGWMHDIQRLNIDDIRDWYDSFYAPNNATVVLAGNINVEQAKQMVTKYYGDIKPRTVKTNKQPKTVSFTGEKRIVVKHSNVGTQTLAMAYLTPSYSNTDRKEVMSIRILSSVLSEGTKSILQKLARDSKLTSNIDASYNPFSRGDSMFMISADLLTGLDSNKLYELESLIEAEISKLQTNPPTKEELQKVKTRLAASLIFGKDSLFLQGYELGMLDTLGLGFDFLQNELTDFDSVTGEDVANAAKKYLTADNKTTAILVNTNDTSYLQP